MRRASPEATSPRAIRSGASLSHVDRRACQRRPTRTPHFELFWKGIGAGHCRILQHPAQSPNERNRLRTTRRIPERNGRFRARRRRMRRTEPRRAHGHWLDAGASLSKACRVATCDLRSPRTSPTGIDESNHGSTMKAPPPSIGWTSHNHTCRPSSHEAVVRTWRTTRTRVAGWTILALQWNIWPGMSATPSRETSGRYSIPPWWIDAGLWMIGAIPNNTRSSCRGPLLVGQAHRP